MGWQLQIERPEFQLVLACCRWPRSPARDEVVRRAAAAVTDWRAARAIVGRHRVAGLVHDAVAAAGVVMPLDLADVLARRTERIAFDNMRLAAETFRLQQAFAAAGLPIVFLKGNSLAQLVHGTLALRFNKDIDALVLPEHAQAAFDLLEREGYGARPAGQRLGAGQSQAIVRNHKELNFVHRASGAEVDLHWRACAIPQLLAGIDARSPTQDVVISGRVAIRTLREADLFAYLCVHGATHAWSRLKWLADFNALIAHMADADVERLYRHAESLGAGLCAAQALLLRQALLGAPLPATLDARLRADRRSRRLLEVALAAVAGEDAAQARQPRALDAWRDVRLLMSLSPGGVSPAPLIRYHLFSVEDLLAVPLPAALRWLYPFLRLPLWVWRRAAVRRRERPMGKGGALP